MTPKGNFKTLRSFGTAKDVRAFRYLVVTSQYRMPLNFSPDTLEGAASRVHEAFEDFLDDHKERAYASAVEEPPGSAGVNERDPPTDLSEEEHNDDQQALLEVAV